MRYSKKYYKSNFATKFKNLLDSRYRKLGSCKRRVEFTKDYDNKFSKDGKSVEQSCKNWFALVSAPDLEKLINICELLDCDIDYFVTDQEAFKKDTSIASETIGLKYDTVDIISNLPIEYKQVIDMLTISGNLKELLKDFYDYAHSSFQHGIITDDVVENMESKERKIDGNELRTIRKYDISIKLNNMLEFLRSCYWNKDLKKRVDDLKRQDANRMTDLADTLKRQGWSEKEIGKKISEINGQPHLDKLYNEFKIDH